MKSRIAALIVGLPERGARVTEALASVQAQTRPVDDTLIGLDPRHYGEAGNMNRLIEATDCDWIAFCHDDDVWHHDHIEFAEPYTYGDYDVIVSDFVSVGRPQNTFEPYHDDWDDLKYTNWFPPSVVIARKEVFGQWIEGRTPTQDPWFDKKDLPRLHSNNPWIDWANWRRLLHEGARFVRTRKRTVDYRFLGDNGSWTAEQAAAAMAKNVLKDPLASMRAAVLDF